MNKKMIDDLVEEWHLAESGDAAFQYSLEDWMMSNTGWSPKQYEEWITTGFYNGEGAFG
jgi:hypothetical protein